MPLSSDAEKTLANFQKEYGAEKGKEYFYAYLNKHGQSDKESMKKDEEECPNCGRKMEDEDEAVRHYEEEVKIMEEEANPRSARSVMNLALKHDDEEDEIKRVEAAINFVKTLKATIDMVTRMAKDEGWPSNSGVSDKVAPSEPTYTQKIDGINVEVAVKQAKGFPVEVNWFNTAMAELKDIVKDANKFFDDAGWNSKEVRKEYEQHKKHWGRDYTAGT